MRFAFSEEQQMFQDAIRAVFQREVPIARTRSWAEEARLGEFDEFVTRQGWLGLGVPEEAGGQGGGLVELALFFEELGRAAAPSGRLLTMTGLAFPLLLRATGGLGPLDRTIESGAGVAVAVPGGRPLDQAGTAVTRTDSKLFGSVPLALDVPAAEHLVVPIRSGDKWELWLVQARGPGVDVTGRQLIDHTRRFADVVFNGAPAQLLGTLSPEDLSEIAARVALLVAAESLGLARRMLEMTTAYIKERVQFGVPVGSFQAVKHSAAEALVDIEAANSGIYYAAWALDAQVEDGPLHAWIAKAFATEAAVRTADRALFLHGAIGYTWEYDLHYFYKRAKANAELFGSPKIYRERIADALQLVPAG